MQNVLPSSGQVCDHDHLPTLIQSESCILLARVSTLGQKAGAVVVLKRNILCDTIYCVCILLNL